MHCSSEELNKIMPDICNQNCVYDLLLRSGGKRLTLTATLSGNNESVTSNVFKLAGSVLIVTATGEVKDATTMSNLTNVYFDLYDGTNTVSITADGATLSGMPVGTLILKDKSSASAVTVVDASQCRVTEGDTSKKTHLPFIVTQKNGSDTYIRCHYTTTDTPINCQIEFIVTFIPLDGGVLEVAE